MCDLFECFLSKIKQFPSPKGPGNYLILDKTRLKLLSSFTRHHMIAIHIYWIEEKQPNSVYGYPLGLPGDFFLELFIKHFFYISLLQSVFSDVRSSILRSIAQFEPSTITTKRVTGSPSRFQIGPVLNSF